MNLNEFYEAHSAQESTDFRFVALQEFLVERMRGRSAADIGCGTGALARDLAARGWRMLAVEPDAGLHALAAASLAAGKGECRLIQATIEEIPASEVAACENVLLIDVLEHIEDDGRMLASIYAKMAPGARLLCLLPALESLYGKRDAAVGHHRRYSLPAARRLFSGVPFQSVEYRYWNLLGVGPYWWFEKLLGRQMPETFRQGPRSLAQKALNAGLLSWFRLVENRVSPPLGLSLLATAVK
ncbi:MAG: class I SAM-dependent methyltransferase [Elusimicrobiota bacterium]